ncbi:uncharacterized protein LOC115254472 [Aedes albopictus]|uniref:Secreted protein n=1 Tax=Aedes albopictus TaxID=7160 RepID=A0ABM1ZI85_AEDAL
MSHAVVDSCPIENKSDEDTFDDIRHTQCATVRNISRRVVAFHQNEPYYLAHVKRGTKRNQLHRLGERILLIMVSILLYNFIFGCSSDDDYGEPSWLACAIGKILGIEDRIYY